MFTVYADKSKAIKYRLSAKIGPDGKLIIKQETFANANLPRGCDAARIKVEESMQLAGDVQSATAKHPIEEKITTPAPVEEMPEQARLDEKQ